LFFHDDVNLKATMCAEDDRMEHERFSYRSISEIEANVRSCSGIPVSGDIRLNPLSPLAGAA
jgi:hypothetical protein